MLEDLGVQGYVEVILEDKNGNEKYREIQKNTITDAYKRYMLYDMFNSGTIANVLRSSVATNYTALDRTAPSYFGIYALGKDIDIKPSTVLPPYVDNTRIGLNKDVVFHNSNGATVETTEVMLYHSPKNIYSKDSKEIVVEYRKTTGTGAIKSVCIGRIHTIKDTAYIVPIKDSDAEAEWFVDYTGNYLLEHSAENGTAMYRNKVNTKSARFNFKSKEFKRYGNIAEIQNNIVNYHGGLVLNDKVFKLTARAANAGNDMTVTITTVPNFLTTTTIQNFTITFSKTYETATATNHTNGFPVMVHNTSTGNIEVFMVVSTGSHDGVYGFHTKKAVINPETNEYVIEDLGVLPFWINNANQFTAEQYMTGSYKDGKYYLPISGVYENETLYSTMTANAWWEGIVIDEDFEQDPEFIMFRMGTTGGVMAYVDTDVGMLPCRVSNIASPYVFTTQVISGMNLGELITKELDDTLRIRYHYRML